MPSETQTAVDQQLPQSNIKSSIRKAVLLAILLLVFLGVGILIGYILGRRQEAEEAAVPEEGTTAEEKTEEELVEEILAEPATGRIIFVSDRENSIKQVFMMKKAGGVAAMLTKDVYGSVYPVYSPQGDKIAFTSERPQNKEIVVINIDGLGETNVTNNSANDEYPAFSLDGSSIVFSSTRLQKSELYLVDTLGEQSANLTNLTKSDDYYESQPCFSPDGEKLVYIADDNYLVYGSDVFLMDIDGSSGPENLTDLASAKNINPRFSLDGTKIVFASKREGNYDIFLMNVDGTGLVNLTNDPADDVEPTFSPDGKMVAFATNRDGNYEIYTMDLSGENLKNLTQNSADDRAPHWSPY